MDYSYAYKNSMGAIHWKSHASEPSDPYRYPDNGEPVVFKGPVDVLPIAWINIDHYKDVVYRVSDGLILQSPVESLVGKQWRCSPYVRYSYDMLEAMEKYPDGEEMEDEIHFLWAVNGNIVWLAYYDDNGVPHVYFSGEEIFSTLVY